MIIKYYLIQLKTEKVLNIKRWNIVFDIILSFMIDTDNINIVKLCFKYINNAIILCWMNIYSYHGKIILFISKLCIKLYKYRDRLHIDYTLRNHQKEIFCLCKDTLLKLINVCKSPKQQSEIKAKLTKLQNIQAMKQLIENVMLISFPSKSNLLINVKTD